MANLTEVEQYDAGVYQIETTDFVVGGADGVTNTPAKNLANRTKWLKAKIDGFLSGAIKAKIAETAERLIPEAFATQAEVNAGIISDKAIAPNTLEGNKNVTRYISPIFDVTYAAEYPITHNLGTKDVRITVYAEIVANPVNCAIGDRFEVGNMVVSYDDYIDSMGVVKIIADVNTIKIRTAGGAGSGLGYLISGVNNDNYYMNWTAATTNNKSRLIVIVEKI